MQSEGVQSVGAQSEGVQSKGVCSEGAREAHKRIHSDPPCHQYFGIHNSPVPIILSTVITVDLGLTDHCCALWRGLLTLLSILWSTPTVEDSLVPRPCGLGTRLSGV